MHWPSAVPGAAAPVGERPRARRTAPEAAVCLPVARRGAAALEDRAEPPGARLVHRGDRVLDRAGALVPVTVGGVELPVRGPRGDRASLAEVHRPDVRKLGRLVVRRPAGGHLRACASHPDETMDVAPLSRVRRSGHAEMACLPKRLPMCVVLLRTRLVTRESVPADCAAARP